MTTDNEVAQTKSVSFKEIFTAKGAIPCFIAFFAYCSLELTTSLWASSYLVQNWELTPEAAAGFASLFYIGVTFGRFANGVFLHRIFIYANLVRFDCRLYLRFAVASIYFRTSFAYICDA